MLSSLPAFPQSSNDRRAYPRRTRGRRVLILSDDCVLDQPFGGMLLDSSAGGLRLLLPGEEIAEGALLKIRSAQGFAGRSWIPVTVRNRRLQEETWELGCQFLQVPFHDEARLFG